MPEEVADLDWRGPPIGITTRQRDPAAAVELQRRAEPSRSHPATGLVGHHHQAVASASEQDSVGVDPQLLGVVKGVASFGFLSQPIPTSSSTVTFDRDASRGKFSAAK